MLILGIDTSCDDTSASVVEDGTTIVSNVVSNQSEIHSKYGGIVPELASRRHIEIIQPVVDEALKKAGASLPDIAAAAVCNGPGLIGSLLVGCSFAKALCYATNIPLVAVNHIEGHILSAFLTPPFPEFPFLSLIVSGGHTSLYLARDFGNYEELGRTRDDAAGEAYDKVSKLLGLGYPGGPVIDGLAQQGDPLAIDFPRAYLPDSLDFSFSGMKTAVLNFLRSHVKASDLPPGPSPDPSGRAEDDSSVTAAGQPKVKHHIAASFQAAMVDVLVRKTEWAVRGKRVSRVTISGGVAANSELRRRMKQMGEERGVEIFVPPAALCTDNAAMIAAAGFHRFTKGDLAGLDLNPRAHLPL